MLPGLTQSCPIGRGEVRTVWRGQAITVDNPYAQVGDRFVYTVHDSGEGWNGTGDWMHFEGYYRDGQFNAAADGNRYDVTSGNIQIHFASYSTANAARRTTTPPGLHSGGRSSVLAISPRARSRSSGRRVRAVRARRSRPLRWSLSRVLGAQGRHVGHSSRPFDRPESLAGPLTGTTPSSARAE